MRLSGTLSKEFFGGEIWVLRGADGRAWQLEGRVPAKLEGRRVVVEAELSENRFGVGMVGDVVDVKRIRAA